MKLGIDGRWIFITAYCTVRSGNMSISSLYADTTTATSIIGIRLVEAT